MSGFSATQVAQGSIYSKNEGFIEKVKKLSILISWLNLDQNCFHGLSLCLMGNFAHFLSPADSFIN